MPIETNPSNWISDDVDTTVNKTRWMTDIWSEIADLKINHLVIPSTHNAGADVSGMGLISGVWAACQDDTFGYQLAVGARYFDLRVKDQTYYKPFGKFGQQLIEKVGFEHGIDTGRRLDKCVETMRAFAVNNPKELIILDIHSLKLGIKDSLNRILGVLSPLNSLLIPESAKELTLRQINQNHPGKNIIILAPGNLRAGNSRYWHHFRGEWAGEDASLQNLELFTEKLFGAATSGSLNLYNIPWVFNAHARNIWGAMRLTAASEYFSKFYRPSSNRGILANIINVDFIDGTGLVEFCIQTNRQRGASYPTPPSAPSNLIAAQIDSTEQVRFTWNAPVNGNISHYEIIGNGNVVLRPRTSPAILNSVAPRKYTFKVRAIDTHGRQSSESNTFELDVKDITPPSTPGNLQLSGVSANTATITWQASYDTSGIQGYEIKINDRYEDFITGLYYRKKYLQSNATYKFEVRAKDNNNLYSRSTTVVLLPRPQGAATSTVSIDILNWSAGKHLMHIQWEPEFDSDVDYYYRLRSPSGIWMVFNKTLKSYWLLVDEGAAHQLEVQTLLPSPDLDDEVPKTLIINISGDTQPPGAVTNAEIKIIDDSSAGLSWAPASGKVSGYAILVNDGIPIYVPSSPCQYTLSDLQPNEDITIEVWAFNVNRIPGESATVIFRP